MMIELQKYLGVGKLYYSRNEINIVVRSLDDITNVIMPQPSGHKLTSYLVFKEVVFKEVVFKEVVLMINNGKHLTPEGFLQILELCYFTNHTTLKSRRLFSTLDTKQAILDKIHNKFGFIQFKPIIESNLSKPNSSPINTDYIVGLVDGDGSFNFGFKSTLKKLLPSVFLDELYLILQLYKEL
jgi:hypothetical protein